jgi:hypothetical protein
MWPYLLLFLFPAYMAIFELQTVNARNKRWSGHWQIAFVLLVMMIGLRHEVGGDWGNDWSSYSRTINSGSGMTAIEALGLKDPGYGLLMWLVGQAGMGLYTLDVLSAVPFTLGLLFFCRAQERPWLALVVAVPYLVMVVAMGYVRQSVAIGFSLLGLVALSQGRVTRFVLWLALAATFHKSAVILMPLAMLASSRNRLIGVFWVSLASLLLFGLLLQEYLDSLILNYITAEYNSQGASIRIAMNAMPAFLFLLFRNRFVISDREQIFWTWVSFVALAFVGLLAVSPSSTAVDRVALYCIPLQLFVLSRLPDAMSQSMRTRSLWVFSVVAYSAAVQLVWLFFAQTAFAWLPYQFYPWVWLWE